MPKMSYTIHVLWLMEVYNVIIGMRGHDFGRMQPADLAVAIRNSGFAATQLAFTKAFPQPAACYMTPEALAGLRETFEAQGIAIPVLGCYVSASDRDDTIRNAAKVKFAESLRASVLLGAGCVGTETTNFTFDESEREAAYARLLDFTRAVCAEAEACGATVGIEPVHHHTLNSPELTRRLIDDVGSDSLRVILDLANLISPEYVAPEKQMQVLERCIDCFGDRVVALHLKDGTYNAEGKWENCPLGEGVMDWANLLPRMRECFDDLCLTREGVWPGLAEQECRLMHAWAEGTAE